MSLRSIASKIAPAIKPSVRKIHITPAVLSDTRGQFGSNLPLPVNNRYALLAVFMIFFSSGLAFPFLSLRAMVLARNQSE